MPSGIAPIATPCRARPTTEGSSDEDIAHSTEPMIMADRSTSRMRRLPNISPSRPLIGVHTAEARRVTVMTQEALVVDVFRRVGRLGMSGTTRVCMSETTMPMVLRVATSTVGVARGGSRSSDLDGSSATAVTNMHVTYPVYRAQFCIRAKQAT